MYWIRLKSSHWNQWGLSIYSLPSHYQTVSKQNTKWQETACFKSADWNTLALKSRGAYLLKEIEAHLTTVATKLTVQFYACLSRLKFTAFNRARVCLRVGHRWTSAVSVKQQLDVTKRWGTISHFISHVKIKNVSFLKVTTHK